MNWMEQAATRRKRKNQILFSKDSEYLQDLRFLLEEQSRRVVILWALDFAAQSTAALEKIYPEERRPREALAAAWDWAAGRIKMPLARRKILDCHAFARELTEKADIAACHGVGQACAVVHAAGHAIGYPVYDLSSILYRLGMEAGAEAVEQRKQAYLDRLFYWSVHWKDEAREWAPFLKE